MGASRSRLPTGRPRCLLAQRGPRVCCPSGWATAGRSRLPFRWLVCSFYELLCGRGFRLSHVQVYQAGEALHTTSRVCGARIQPLCCSAVVSAARCHHITGCMRLHMWECFTPACSAGRWKLSTRHGWLLPMFETRRWAPGPWLIRLKRIGIPSSAGGRLSRAAATRFTMFIDVLRGFLGKSRSIALLKTPRIGFS